MVSPLSMDIGGALGLESIDPFDFDCFTFNTDYLLSASSAMPSVLSPLECATQSNASPTEVPSGNNEATCLPSELGI